MEKKHKIIWRIVCVLVVLFFFGACGEKKEETPKKPNVVSKKVVSKKISKPAPKKVKKVKPDAAAKDTSDSKGKASSKKSSATAKQPKADTGEKKKASETTLTAKKKPAFKPKTEISEESDYKEAPAVAVKVAKKDVSKPSASSEKPQTEKDGKEKKEKSEREAAKEARVKESKSKEKSAEIKKDKNVESEEVAEKEEDASAEVKDPDKLQSGNKQIAGLTPSRTLAPVKIPPLSQNYNYRPEGKIDPFSSLFQVESEKKKKRKRFPLTPLEQRDISQFKLVGIILSAKGNKAIVQGASGKGYVIQRGTYIGVNDGRVVKILKDRVICEEEVENLFGQIEIKARILKINKPPGAL